MWALWHAKRDQLAEADQLRAVLEAYLAPDARVRPNFFVRTLKMLLTYL